ncbi:MAG TPA: hypothetical protein IAD08_03595 [Candidatus Scatovivens faecipullorum]|nr:hypothetical protein [Candidatus Scatovivens faecipullorum]
MENASKALLIAGAILLAILIIAIGMFIYNSAQSTINNSMQSMSTQEVQAFNNEFMSFEGRQTGSNIKSMIGTLIANANTYRDEPTKIPGVVFDKVNNSKESSVLRADVPEASQPQSYINSLNTIRNSVEPKHQYWVSITNQDNGLIDGIYVTYEAGNQGSDAKIETDGLHNNDASDS